MNPFEATQVYGTLLAL